MLSDDEFSELMRRTRAGDQDAARELVELYEPQIRRAARLRLTDPGLRRMVDSVDICQSVFGRFFKNAGNGEFDLQKPEQLLALLTTMMRNRIIDEHRRQTTQKRAGSAAGSGGADVVAIDPDALASDTPGPGTVTATRELLSQIRARLTPAELDLADRRNSGQPWEEIAAELGQSVGGLRKKLERAMQRVRAEMEAADSKTRLDG